MSVNILFGLVSTQGHNQPTIKIHPYLNYVCRIWQHRLWSFKLGDTKLDIFLPKSGQNGNFDIF